MKFLEQCFQVLDNHGVDRDQKLLVAVSGGLDSMVLLDVLRKSDYPIQVAHVNYKTRGEDSDKDQQLVEAYCRKYGIPFHLNIADSAESKGNFQNWARQQRYQFFDEILKTEELDYLVTAHHYDDQIETILLKLFRGSSPQNYGGLKEISGIILRPLLSISKAELKTYAMEYNVNWREDESNQKTDYARNLIRKNLGSEFDTLLPGWRENVLRLGQFGQNYADLIQRYSSDYIKGNKVNRNWIIDQPDYVIEEVFRHIVVHTFPQFQKELSAGSFAELEKIKKLQTGKTLAFTNSLRILRSRDAFLVTLSDAVPEKVYLEHSVDDLPVHYPRLQNLNITIGEFKSVDKKKLQISHKAVGERFSIRTWQVGDRIRPLGMDGHQKISDVIINRKIPSEKKNEVFVFQSFDENICAVIFPEIKNQDFPGIISEDAKCQPGDQCLVIQKNFIP